MNNITSLAKHDRTHCLFPGLFRSLKRGERKKTNLNVTYNIGDGETVTVTCYEALGADDMRILQTIVSLAGPYGVELPVDGGAVTKKLRKFMDAKSDDALRKSLVVKDTIYRLLKESGMDDSGQNRNNVMDSIRRLSRTVWTFTSGKREVGGFTMISYDIDEINGKIYIALNPRITSAILGNSQFVNINMHEVRALKSDAARLIHQRLCGYINPGKFHLSTIDVDTLSSYVWVDSVNVKIKVDSLRQRRNRVRKGLIELSELGWHIEETAQGKYTIGRPQDVLSLKKRSSDKYLNKD